MSAARSKATLLGTALLAAPLSAQAWIDDDPATDWTALTLHRNEWRLGLFRFQYGIVDSLQVGTQTLPWVLKISNLDLKWTVWSSGPWSVGLSGGIFSLKLQDYDADAADVRFYAAPLELTASWRGDGLGVHLRGSYTAVKTDTDEALDEEDYDIGGVAAVSTGTLGLAGEWYVSRTFSWVLETRLSVFQDASANASTTTQIDPRTSIEFNADAEADLTDGRQANALLSAFWSWNSFNLKLGLGYGHYSVPTLNLFVGDPIWFPDFDLFWRF
ncbi:MAG: hypothetical protein H6704_18920 [Myxococcales bacterium]|nr:hypothetical protein [Myxococcales bacterium]MCB9538328.1 hypothetical protein [Myxococcales bacterium]